MSDTPETDAEIGGTGDWAGDTGSYEDAAGLCRQMERQRNEARACLRDVLGRFSPYDWMGLRMMIGGVHKYTTDRWSRAAGIDKDKDGAWEVEGANDNNHGLAERR